MAKWGSFDFGAFENFAKNFEKSLADDVVGKFIEDFLMEMAMRAIRKIKKRTPVGNYGTYKKTITRGKNKGQVRTYKQKGSHGMVGGNLRRNWTVGNVVKQGDSYIVEIFNNVEYASYVEYGHRQEVGRFVPAIGKRLKKPWVEGRFMMTISMKEMERELPRYLEKRIVGLMNDIVRGKTPRKG